MKLSLLVMTSGKQEGKTIEVKLPQFLVGRDPQCQLRPASPLISKRHCALIQRDSKAFIRDFGSTNGTFVNDERVEGERELQNDDQLKIGPIHLQVKIDLTAKVDLAKTPAPPTKNPTKAAPKPTDTPAPTTVTGLSAESKPATENPVETESAPATPVSKTTKSAGKSAEAEDDIAAMLLELDDGDSSSAGLGGGEIPQGSTVFDLKVPPEVGAAADQQNKDSKAKSSGSGDTRSAAASILEKMMKRPRNE